MLFEVTNTKQIPGEPNRRWFTSYEQDLYVWLNEAKEIIAFQLCYSKHSDEHAIYWRKDRGFSHLKVDDGEGRGLGSSTPILLADGYFDRDCVLNRFLSLSNCVSNEVATFVREKLSEYPCFHGKTDT